MIAGFEDRGSRLKTKTQVRAEVRNGTIIYKPITEFSGTMENAGTAHFLSLAETVSTRISSRVLLRADVLASYSILSRSGNPFPRLPYLSAGGAFVVNPTDTVSLETQAKWMGRSTEFDGSNLPAYALLGQKISMNASQDLIVTLGLDNLLDSRIEMIRGYPLPGRMAYASLEMKF
jgi:hypothetical protein